MKTIFITGATGYIGKRLIKILLQRGHRVIGLARKGNESKLPPGVETVIAILWNCRIGPLMEKKSKSNGIGYNFSNDKCTCKSS